jgi:hypothetical protein
MVEARLDDLQQIESAVWRELQAAPVQRGHEWRIGTLATTDGESGDARSVVLRDFEAATRTLIVYTDSRSPKTAQIAAYPLGTLVLWSASLSWQLRLRVRLEVETSGLRVSSRWARLKMKPGAQDYLSPLPPGSPLARPTPERGSRDHFALMLLQIQAIDWLELHAEGHRRAGFDEQGRQWLSP